MDNFDLKRFLIENKLTRNSTLLNENINIDEQGNLVYSLEDADVDYSDSSEILLTWEINDVNPKLIRKFEWDDTEDTIHTYIDVDELKDFIKNPVELTKKFEAPNGYVVVDKQDARDLMESYYENFEDEIDPELNENHLTRNFILSENDNSDEWNANEWTTEKLKQEAAKYNTPDEFKKANLGAYNLYQKAVEKGILFDKFTGKLNGWTIDDIEQEANKYDKLGTLRKRNLTGFFRYVSAVDKGLIQNKFKDFEFYTKPSKKPISSNSKPTTTQSIKYPNNNPYFGTPTTTFDKLKENKMQDFDLKRFLVENKMTRNSKLLNEQPEPDGIPSDDPLAQIPEVPAETPSEPSGEIDKETTKELIFDTKGKFFTVKFIKKDGSERVMNARLGVKKYLKGGTLAYDPAEFNYITVYDMGAKGYRMVNANTIKNLKIGKNEYVIPTAVSESEEPELNEGMTKENIISILKKYENPTNPFYKSNFSDYITDLKSYEYEGMSLSDMNSEEDVITDYKKWKKSGF